MIHISMKMMILYKIIRSMPCFFKEVTHFYCPACGGTRSVIALLHLDIERAFLCNPTVVYTGVMFLWCIAGWMVKKLTARKRCHMKEWKEYLFKVNGFEMTAVYNEDTIQKVFLPLLKQLQQLQKEKKERIIVFMAAPPAVGKTTLCEFLEYLSKQDQEFTDIQALGLDGFHYHSDYINSHDAIVLGKKVPMKQVKGCPETYDTEKLRQKLEKIKIEDILWPIYDRNLHDVVENQIKVTKDIILIEGNWLLLKQEPWKSMQQYADYKILILAEEEMLKERLISRKEKGGLTREEAVAWYQNSDSKNVKRVLKDSCRKHLNLLLQVEQDNDYLQVK